MYAHVSDIPGADYKGIEVEAIAIEKDPGGKYFCARVICCPEDGPLRMCSVYLREEGGGALCIADLPTKEEAFDYAAKVSQARGWQVKGTIYDLRIREVPGKGYLADPREPGRFTLDPAKAALYHSAIAKDDLFVGGPGSTAGGCLGSTRATIPWTELQRKTRCSAGCSLPRWWPWVRARRTKAQATRFACAKCSSPSWSATGRIAL